jgi:hypothetical protein
MKPLLKAPGSMLLKPTYGEPLSTFAFKFNLHRYNMGLAIGRLERKDGQRIIDEYVARVVGGGGGGGSGGGGGGSGGHDRVDSRGLRVKSLSVRDLSLLAERKRTDQECLSQIAAECVPWDEGRV